MWKTDLSTKNSKIVDKKFINSIVENSADVIVDNCETFRETLPGMTIKKHKKKRINTKKAYITVKKWEKYTTKALKTSKKWD